MGPSPSSSPASSRASSPGASSSRNAPGLLAFGGANSNSTLFGPRNTDDLPAYSQLPSDSEATVNIGYTIGESPIDIDAEMGSGEVSPVSSVIELDTNEMAEPPAGPTPELGGIVSARLLADEEDAEWPESG